MTADEAPRCPGDFALTLTTSTGGVLVAVRGELDLLTAEAFGAFLDVATVQAGRVVVDLAELTFIDCSGLGQLARALARVRGRGGDLAIVSPSPMTYKLLELSGFTEVMDVERPLPTMSASVTTTAPASRRLRPSRGPSRRARSRRWRMLRR
jgi:anti-anti-sigma factor